MQHVSYFPPTFVISVFTVEASSSHITTLFVAHWPTLAFKPIGMLWIILVCTSVTLIFKITHRNFPIAADESENSLLVANSAQWFPSIQVKSGKAELIFLSGRHSSSASTVSVEWYDLEAVALSAPLRWLWILETCTNLAHPQLVLPVALCAGRRRAGSWSRRNRRSCDEDLVCVGCRRGRCRWRDACRPLDGWFVVSPQEAHAWWLLLGLLCLLLHLQLLVEDQLDILLRHNKENKQAVRGDWNTDSRPANSDGSIRKRCRESATVE